MTDTNIIRCGHCLKQGSLEVREEGSQDGAKVDNNYHDGQDITVWLILECIYCQKPTLEEVKRSYEFVIDDVYGETYTKAVEHGQEALEALIASAYKHQENLPEPQTFAVA